jgi:hypothetical protein
MADYEACISRIPSEVLQGLRNLRKEDPQRFDKLESLVPTADQRHRMPVIDKFIKDYFHFRSMGVEKARELFNLKQSNPVLFNKLDVLLLFEGFKSGLDSTDDDRHHKQFLQSYIYLKAKIPPDVSQELEDLRNKNSPLFDHINSNFFDSPRGLDPFPG